MTSNTVIVSVPHCGTRFLKERLGIEDSVHTHDTWRRVLKTIEGRSCIVPMREPVDVFRSWCRRADPKEFPFGEFFLAWGCLHALDQMLDLDVICVDQHRDSRITDWSPVGHGDNSRADWILHKVDLRGIYKLPIVERNYSSWAKAA